jgi:hypothetical protein
VVAAVNAGRRESQVKTTGGGAEKEAFLKAATFKDFGPGGPSVEDFREVMSHLPGIQRSMAFSNLLAQLTPENAREVMAFIGKNASKYDMHREHEMFWERWGQIDGRAACEAIFESNKRFAQTPMSQRTIQAWARNDPRGAYTWLMAQEDLPLRASMVRGVLNGYAAADPEGAHQFIATELQDATLKNHGYWRVARSQMDANGLPGVEAYFARFDKSDPDYKGVRITVADMFVDAGSAEALRWMSRLDAAAQPEVSSYLTSRLVHDRPDDLVRSLAADSIATGFDRTKVITEAVKGWIGANPNAMGQWLKENRQMPNYDEIVVPYVKQIRAVDAQAATAWAATIKDPVLRQAAETVE